MIPIYPINGGLITGFAGNTGVLLDFTARTFYHYTMLYRPLVTPRRFWIVLAVLGIVVSTYALRHHIQVMVFGSSSAACNINTVFDCDRIAKSAFSVLFNIPLAVYGIGYFTTIVAVLSLGSRFARFELASVQTYSFLVLLGVLTSFALSVISAFRVQALCIVCLSFYALTWIQGVSLYLSYRKAKWPLFGRSFLKGYLFSALFFGMLLLSYRSTENKIRALFADPKYEAEVTQFIRTVLRLSPSVIPFIKAPPADASGDIWFGNPDSEVVFVEFLDHTCGACQNFAPVFHELLGKFSDRVLFIVKHYPLEKGCNPHQNTRGHLNACKSAQLAQCAHQRGKYLLFQKSLFFREKQWAEPSSNLLPMLSHLYAAKEVGISETEIEECLKSPEILRKVSTDCELAHTIGARGTPAIFINGWRYRAQRTVEVISLEFERYFKSKGIKN